jgi:hypothetical protein
MESLGGRFQSTRVRWKANSVPAYWPRCTKRVENCVMRILFLELFFLLVKLQHHQADFFSRFVLAHWTSSEIESHRPTGTSIFWCQVGTVHSLEMRHLCVELMMISSRISFRTPNQHQQTHYSHRAQWDGPACLFTLDFEARKTLLWNNCCFSRTTCDKITRSLVGKYYLKNSAPESAFE